MLSGPGRLVVRKLRKHKEVSNLVTWSKAESGVTEFVAAESIHMPLIWTLWHDEKPSALTMRLFQSTKTPQKRIARC